ncbi:MAG: rubrerythrin family protein [Phycisphaerae bacterium]|nr:rubrerythrin family protein [Phycisphaerae bacterium]
MDTNTPAIDPQLRQKLLLAQKNEITEHHIYSRLAKCVKNDQNRQILQQIAADEKRHYEYWRTITGADVKPDMSKARLYVLIARTLGLTFAVKSMEKGEAQAEAGYRQIAQVLPGAEKIAQEEDQHENQLINMINEERLQYIGSMVLGLNDALVELTGALAGFTLALRDTRLIAMVGLITGVAASFSMAASEYLSQRSEEDGQNPLKSSLYTGSAYILTVIFLIFPYLILHNPYLAIAWTMFNALLVIFFFTFYMSVAKDYSFRRRFLEMAGLSFGVATLTFGIGFLVRIFFDIDV